MRVLFALLLLVGCAHAQQTVGPLMSQNLLSEIAAQGSAAQATARANLGGIPGTGTVTGPVSVATANGFNGSVTAPTTIPVITIGTPLTGVLKGTGAALAVATPGVDYISPAGGTLTGLLTTAASSLSGPGLILPQGVQPTMPPNGAVWMTSAGMFYQAAGLTFGPLNTGGGGGNPPAGTTGCLQTNGGSGLFGSLCLGSGQIAIGQLSGTPLGIAPTGDATISTGGVIAVSKTGGVPFGSLATLNAAPAGTLTGPALASGITSAPGLTTVAGGPFGTAAFVNTGASGGVVPLLNAPATISALWTVTNSNFRMVGAGTGNNTLTSNNTSATNYINALPAATGNLAYQVGSLTTGHCLVASGTVGGLADSGSTNCGGGGGGSLSVTDGVNPSISGVTGLTLPGTACSGSTPNASCSPISTVRYVTSCAASACHIVAGDMGNTVVFNGSGLTAVFDAISSSVLAAGQNVIIINANATALGITTTPTWRPTAPASLPGLQNGVAAGAGIGSDGTFLYPAFNLPPNIVFSTLADQVFTGGFWPTALSNGTGSGSGTITVDVGARLIQTVTNGGPFNLALSAHDGSTRLLVTNNGSAGPITFSGFSEGIYTGDPLDTTNGHSFILYLDRISGLSHYLISALQGTFFGIEDSVSNVAWCYSFQACSSAIAAAGTQKLFKARRASDNETCDVIVATNGLPGLTANCSGADNNETYAVFVGGTSGFLVTKYDQSGAGLCSGACDVTQATSGNQPAIVQNCAGTSLLCAQYSANQVLVSAALASSPNQPISTTAVAQRTGAFTTAQWLQGTNTSNMQMGWDSTANNMRFFAGSAVITAAATDSATHGSVTVFSGSSSFMAIDGGTPATGNPGTNGLNGVISIGSDSTLAGDQMTGFSFEEAGFTVDATSVASAACHNQRIRYGTPGSC